MIRVEPREPDSDAWRAWVELAEQAADDMIEAVRAGNLPAIDEAFYKRQKAAIWSFFNGKCAYCEVRLAGSQHGDIEHFRPKKAVIGKEGTPVRDPRTGMEHPGYYWLAYDWRNLIPSCELCNGPATGPNGEPYGKRNYFPLVDETRRAFGPDDDVSREQPGLLHPYFDRPEEHLVFDDLGIVAGKTPRGRETVELLKLNRDGLLDERRTQWMQIQGLFTQYLDLALASAPTAALYREQVEGYVSGVKPYSGMARALLRRLRRNADKALDFIRGTPPSGTPTSAIGAGARPGA